MDCGHRDESRRGRVEAGHARRSLGALESWASGVLFDNVVIDGAGIHFENRWRADGGVGWSAANCTLWQSNAAEIRCFNPPGATNRAVGTWGTPAGDGVFESQDEFVKPRSLFKAQLAKRLGGAEEVAHLGPIGRDYIGATNPTLAESENFVAESSEPARTLRETIAAASKREPLWDGELPEGAVRNPSETKKQAATAKRTLSIENGQLHVGDQPLRGKRFVPIWWRGNIRPDEAPSFGSAITRFVPGRIGRGFTDDLKEVADEMLARESRSSSTTTAFGMIAAATITPACVAPTAMLCLRSTSSPSLGSASEKRGTA